MDTPLGQNDFSYQRLDGEIQHYEGNEDDVIENS